MSYWDIIPAPIRKSKRLTGDEKELLYELWIRGASYTPRYCSATNAELSKALNVTHQTLSNRLSALEARGYICRRFNPHLHKRIIYVSIPGEPSAEEIPIGKVLEERVRPYEELLKKAIVFGTIEFNVLIEKLKESPYLENVEDNQTQFLLNQGQIDFLHKFYNLTKKELDCQLACYPNVDLNRLFTSIRESDFIIQNSNLNLKWCLEHSEEIISGKYKYYIPGWANQKYKPNFKQRNIPKEMANKRFQSIEDIDV